MNLSFGVDFDGGSWPGPLADKDAVAGEAWVGQAGLLSILETALGLRHPAEPDAVRAAALVPALKSLRGFWSESAEVDPLGTARRLLVWRDRLHLHGWRGQGLGGRLTELAAVTKEATPGFPDRLAEVASTLARRRPEIESIRLADDPVYLPTAWRSILDLLSLQGTRIGRLPLHAPKSRGDLQRARAQTFAPKGDGSLQLLRPSGVLTAAHQVAAWLSAQKDLDSTIIIGGDVILDEALHRFGLPATGAADHPYDNTLLQILPLILDMGWNPPDPQRALELLTLPVSPVPRGIARRLAEALRKWPAVDSDLWRQELTDGLGRIEDQERRKGVEDRLEALFRSPAKGTYYPRHHIHQRIRLLQDWARGRMAHEQDGATDWHLILAQAGNLDRLVGLTGLDKMTEAQLRRMVLDATMALSPGARHPAQAGLGAVAYPGSVCGPAKRVVWWNFHRGAALLPEQLPLTMEERAALKKAGVDLPDRGEEALAWSGRWRRPLDFAGEALLLACPAQGPAGEECFPHPLWDELTARAKGGLSGLVVKEITGMPMPTRGKREHLPLPPPKAVWQVPAGLVPARQAESPSSLEKLIGCPLSWALRHFGQLYGGVAASLPDLRTLEGSLMHELMARLLLEGALRPGQAGKKAGALFDKEGPRLAAPLFLPGNQHRQARTRKALVDSAEQLAGIMKKAGLSPTKVEEEVSASVKALGFTLKGYPDLVTNGAVIDFKRGRAGHWLDSLRNGACLQLACYAYAVAKGHKGAFPPAGIFLLREARLLTNSPKVFPGADEIQGPSLGDTWEGLVRAVSLRLSQLGKGEVACPGADPGGMCPDKSCLADGCLELAPACGFCDYGTLCGVGRES